MMTMTTLPPLVQSQAFYRATVRELTGLDAGEAEQAVISGHLPKELDFIAISDRVVHQLRIGTSERQIKAFWQGRRTPAQRLDYLLLTTRILAQVQPVLGEENARHWLQEPNEHLDGHTPLELLRTSTGERRVQGLIQSLLSGYYP